MSTETTQAANPLTQGTMRPGTDGSTSLERTQSFHPWFTTDGRFLPFEARIHDSPDLVTINPNAVAYITPGSHPARTTLVCFGSGHSVEIVVPYAGLSAALKGSWSYDEYETGH